MPWKTIQPVLDESVRQLCVRRYPGHPRGCPNYGKRPTCPPAAPLLREVMRMDRPIWVVWNAFDLAGHVERLRAKHTDWSWRQLVCCLYWQGGARKNLLEEIKKLLSLLGPSYTVYVSRCPEACGVNVTATMQLAGIKLEWPPRTVAHQVALVGTPRGDALYCHCGLRFRAA